MATIYVNPAAYESLTADRELKAGSLIVMENRDTDGSLRGQSVRGYHEAGSDWYWLEYNQQGEATTGGRGYDCLACHREGKDMTRTQVQQTR